MLDKLDATLSGALAVAAKALGIWFVVWGIRRKGEFDYKLDGIAQLLRWLIVAACFAAVANFSKPSAQRATALTLGLAFFVWPNFAYHLRNLFRRGDGSQNSP
jgi:hypothetical protein